MAEIEIRGLDPLIKKYGRFDAMQKLRPPMVRSVGRVHRRIATYPPRPPGSTYRRTGTLGRGWTEEVTVSPAEIRGVVGNRVRYARYVQGDQDQARQHRGRWPTDEQVMRNEEAAIRRDFEQVVLDELGS